MYTALFLSNKALPIRRTDFNSDRYILVPLIAGCHFFRLSCQHGIRTLHI